MRGLANNFDGLRLLGALAVLVSHQFAITGRDEPDLADLTLGRWGVLLFFGISGYLVAKSWRSDPNLGHFLIRRMLRIVPALAVLSMMTSIVMRSLGITIFADNPLPLVNGSLWSINVEVQCYLLLPMLALTLRRFSLPMIAVCLFADWWFDYLPEIGLFRLAYFLTPFGVTFGVGASLAEYPALRRLPAVLGVAVAGVLVWSQTQSIVGLGMVAAPVAVYIGAQSWPLLRDAGRRGDFSYGLYLYAFPVQQLWVMVFGPGPFAALLAASLGATLVLSALSWHLVEKPAMSLKRYLKPTRLPRFTGDHAITIRTPQPLRVPRCGHWKGR